MMSGDIVREHAVDAWVIKQSIHSHPVAIGLTGVHSVQCLAVRMEVVCRGCIGVYFGG